MTARWVRDGDDWLVAVPTSEGVPRGPVRVARVRPVGVSCVHVHPTPWGERAIDGVPHTLYDVDDDPLCADIA